MNIGVGIQPLQKDRGNKYHTRNMGDGHVHTDGTISSNESYYATDFIQIKHNVKYFIENFYSSSGTYITFYDRSFNKVGHIDETTAGVKTAEIVPLPTDSFYIRFTIRREHIDIIKFYEL